MDTFLGVLAHTHLLFTKRSSEFADIVWHGCQSQGPGLRELWMLPSTGWNVLLALTLLVILFNGKFQLGLRGSH